MNMTKKQTFLDKFRDNSWLLYSCAPYLQFNINTDNSLVYKQSELFTVYKK